MLYSPTHVHRHRTARLTLCSHSKIFGAASEFPLSASMVPPMHNATHNAKAATPLTWRPKAPLTAGET